MYQYFYSINISEVHRIYQILEEEDNIKIMTTIEASSPNATNETTETPQYEAELNMSIEIKGDATEKVDQNQVLIKTETRTGYVNIDGTEREKTKNESTLRDIVKERINSYYNDTNANLESDEELKPPLEHDTPTTEFEGKFDVDDIIVPQSPPELLQTPSESKAKETFKILPKVIQDFLNSDWKSKPKCEPQHMLERIRKENRYPAHPDVNKFELLLTPAPSFLQRISLAGQFLNKKQLEM